MKILINATPLLAARSGVGRYTRSLSEALLQIDAANEYEFFAPPRFTDRLPDFALESNNAPTYSRIKDSLRKLKKYPLWVDWGRRQLFGFGGKLRHYELYHELNSVPLGFPAPIVLTILDLSVRLYPETHPRVRVDVFNKYFYQSLSRVRRIITISQAIKNELVELLGIPAEKVDVVHLAADSHFRPLDPELVRQYLQKRELPPRYILYLGTLEPRKNLSLLIEAYSELPLDLRYRFPLVLAGFKGWPGDDSPYRVLEAQVDRLGIKEQVIFTGFVPESELPLLYNGAVAFVFPSLYEGFGLPPLEAMQCGIPVLVSSAPALSEVVANAGIVLPANNKTAWTESLRRILGDSDMRVEYKQRGMARALDFSWDKCARETIAVYQTALA